jgi:hypothetical protein
MKIKPIIILFPIGCLVLVAGCAGKYKTQIQKKLMMMTDRELINHYEMLEMRMVDIDRARDQSEEKKQEMYNRHYPPEYQNQLGHLHIGDNWSKIKKEKELTRIEMRKLGISPPYNKLIL